MQGDLGDLVMHSRTCCWSLGGSVGSAAAFQEVRSANGGKAKPFSDGLSDEKVQLVWFVVQMR